MLVILPSVKMGEYQGEEEREQKKDLIKHCYWDYDAANNESLSMKGFCDWILSFQRRNVGFSGTAGVYIDLPIHQIFFICQLPDIMR